MADIVRRRHEREAGGQMAGLEPIRSLWNLFGGLEPLRDLDRAFRIDQERTFIPRIDVKDSKDAYVFQVDLPGVKEADADIAVLGNRLTISGRRELEKEQTGDTYYAIERAYGAFSRSFILPEGADADSIRAELKDGVLTVTVPKKPDVQPRKVPLGEGQSAPAGGHGNKSPK